MKTPAQMVEDIAKAAERKRAAADKLSARIPIFEGFLSKLVSLDYKRVVASHQITMVMAVEVVVTEYKKAVLMLVQREQPPIRLQYAQLAAKIAVVKELPAILNKVMEAEQWDGTTVEEVEQAVAEYDTFFASLKAEAKEVKE